MWRHIGYEMFREKKERKSQKEGIRRKRETGKHSKKVCTLANLVTMLLNP